MKEYIVKVPATYTYIVKARNSMEARRKAMKKKEPDEVAESWEDSVEDTL